MFMCGGGEAVETLDVRWDQGHGVVGPKRGLNGLELEWHPRPAWRVLRSSSGGGFQFWQTESWSEEIPSEVPLAGRLALRLQQRSLIGISRQQIACCIAAAEVWGR